MSGIESFGEFINSTALLGLILREVLFFELPHCKFSGKSEGSNLGQFLQDDDLAHVHGDVRSMAISKTSLEAPIMSSMLRNRSLVKHI
jgi:hypothetical protein